MPLACPSRYLPLFGSGIYDAKNEREGDVSFEDQLKGLEKVIKAGKVSICCPAQSRLVFERLEL